MQKKKVTYSSKSHSIEDKMARDLDDLADFEEYRRQIPKEVRKDIANGRSADVIFKKHAAMAAARLVSIAATDEDPKNAIAAAKDIIDRSQGRATEKKEITHRYQNLSDEELNSLILSESEDIKDEEQKKNAN